MPRKLIGMGPHLVGTSLGTFAYGPHVLIVAGVFLAAGMLGFGVRRHRRVTIPYQRMPAPAPIVSRPGLAFTPAEFARARALVESAEHH